MNITIQTAEKCRIIASAILQIDFAIVFAGIGLLLACVIAKVCALVLITPILSSKNKETKNVEANTP